MSKEVNERSSVNESILQGAREALEYAKNRVTVEVDGKLIHRTETLQEAMGFYKKYRLESPASNKTRYVLITNTDKEDSWIKFEIDAVKEEKPQ